MLKIFFCVDISRPQFQKKNEEVEEGKRARKGDAERKTKT
jgi:hypothetical protein